MAGEILAFTRDLLTGTTEKLTGLGQYLRSQGTTMSEAERELVRAGLQEVHAALTEAEEGLRSTAKKQMTTHDVYHFAEGASRPSSRAIPILESYYKQFGTNILDMKSSSRQGNAAIHEAVLSGNLETIKWLHEHGANLNLVNGNGNTPLTLAALALCHRRTRDHNEVFKYVLTLIDQGVVDPSIQNDQGDTALHRWAQSLIYHNTYRDDDLNSGLPQSIRLVVAKRPDLIHERNEAGKTAVTLISEHIQELKGLHEMTDDSEAVQTYNTIRDAMLSAQ
jgi:hypothetical protein